MTKRRKEKPLSIHSMLFSCPCEASLWHLTLPFITTLWSFLRAVWAGLTSEVVALREHIFCKSRCRFYSRIAGKVLGPTDPALAPEGNYMRSNYVFPEITVVPIRFPPWRHLEGLGHSRTGLPAQRGGKLRACFCFSIRRPGRAHELVARWPRHRKLISNTNSSI